MRWAYYGAWRGIGEENAQTSFLFLDDRVQVIEIGKVDNITSNTSDLCTAEGSYRFVEYLLSSSGWTRACHKQNGHLVMHINRCDGSLNKYSPMKHLEIDTIDRSKVWGRLYIDTLSLR
jgi:hypothetical protein